ncbi:MAG: hypothetical protein E5W40_03660, partial [Mesorhizobium sp.]
MVDRLEFIPPMEPKLVAKPPGGEDWIHEIKLDGYRSQIVINSPEDICVFTKTGADWTNKYAGLVEAARELEVGNAIIDGEAVVTNEAGLPDFAARRKPSTAIPIQCISAPPTSCTSTVTICVTSAARRAAKSSTASSSQTAGSSSARPCPATRRRSSISPTRPASR